MLQEIFVHGLAMVLDRLDCPLQVNGVPEDYGGCHQIEAGSAIRPKALSEADLKKARALLRLGDYSKVQVAEELEVSRHTLWRALGQELAK